MAGGVRKLGVGDPVKIAAKDYNRWQDAGVAHAMTRLSQFDSPVPPDSLEGVILVKNTTAIRLPRFSILGLNGSVCDPNYDTQSRMEFKNQIALKGDMPSSDYAGKFCVLQNDARPGEVVAAMVSGVTPCLLKVSATTDPYAEVETDTAIDNRTRYLKTGSTGAAQVIFTPEQTGEHWGVIRMSNKPISSSSPKIIRYAHLPAAFGGSSTTGISGSAAVTNGNTNPTNRKIFPKLWQNAYEMNSSGELIQSTDTGYVANLGSLPLNNGWGIATKLAGTTTNFGDVWAIFPDAPSHYGTADFTWESEESSGDWTLEDGDAILLRAASYTGNTTTSLWAHRWGGDVMLTHPGVWEVTYGYRGYASEAFYTHTTSDASSGTAHTHTFKLPAGFTVEFGLHQNFQPGTSTVGTISNSQHEMNHHHSWGNPYNSNNHPQEYEKTAFVDFDSTPWHGQPHTRLSLFCKVTKDGSAEDDGNEPRFVITRAWMSIRPAVGKGGVDFYGAGANQYPGGYDGVGDTFVWYGGGSEPVYIDEDGAAI